MLNLFMLNTCTLHGQFAFITPGLTFDTNMTGMYQSDIEPSTLLIAIGTHYPLLYRNWSS